MSSNPTGFTPDGVNFSHSNSVNGADPFAHLTESFDFLNTGITPDRYMAYVAQLTDALHTFHDPLTPAQVLSLVRLWTARQVVNECAYMYTGRLMQSALTLIRSGHEQEALDTARSIIDPEQWDEFLWAIYYAWGKIVSVPPPRNLVDEILSVVRASSAEDRAAMLIRIATQDTIPDEALLAEGIAATYAIIEDWLRQDMLVRIADRIQHTHPQQARNLIDDALLLARKKPRNQGRALDLRDIAGVLTSIADPRAAQVFAEARDAAQHITDIEAFYSIPIQGVPEDQQTEALIKLVLKRITESQIASGFMGTDEALPFARSQESLSNQVDYLAILGVRLARTADSRADALFAEIMALALCSDEQGTDKFGSIAWTYLRAGFLDPALQAARAIRSKRRRFRVWRLITQYLPSADKTLITNVADEILAAIQNDAPSEEENLPTDAGRYAQEQIKENKENKEAALRGIAWALALIGDPRAPDLYAQTLENTIAAQSRKKAGQDRFAEALATVGQVALLDKLVQGGKPEYQVDDCCRIAQTLSRRHDPRAANWFDRALSGARLAGYRHNVASNLRTIIEAMFDCGFSADIYKPIIDEVLNIAQAIRSEIGENETFDKSANNRYVNQLAKLAVVMHKIGDPRADALFTEATNRALTGSLALALIQVGRIDEGWKIINEKVDLQQRSIVQSDALKQLAEAGDVETVRRLRATLDESGQYNTQSWKTIALACAGKLDTMRAEMHGQELSKWTRQYIGSALAKAGYMAEAFESLGVLSFYDYVANVTGWAAHFEQVEPGLTLAVLQEIARIGAWIYPSLLGIHALLTISESNGSA